MELKPRNIKQQLLPLIFQAGGGIVIALVVWLVVARLPMVEEIQLPVYFTLAQLLSAVILTVIMATLVSFGKRMETRLAVIITGFPASGNIVKLSVFLIVIGIGYAAYRPLLEPYWGDLEWVYPVFFLVVFLGVMGALAHTIYTHLERLGTLLVVAKQIVGAKQTVVAPQAPRSLACTACGEKNEVGGGFCSSCGAKLSLPETVASNCKGCEAVLKPDTRFCVSCGLPVGETASQEGD